MKTEEERAHAVAQIIEEIRKVEWSAAWTLRDFCRDLVERNDEGFLRRVAKELSWSWRTIQDFAAVAAHFPSENRSSAHSPTTHASWRKKDLKDSAQKGSQ